MSISEQPVSTNNSVSPEQTADASPDVTPIADKPLDKSSPVQRQRARRIRLICLFLVVLIAPLGWVLTYLMTVGSSKPVRASNTPKVRTEGLVAVQPQLNVPTQKSTITSSEAAPAQSTHNKIEAIPLPAEYITLAEVLGMTIDRDPDNCLKEINFVEQTHQQIMKLDGITTADKDIDYLAKLGRSGLNDALQSFERFKTLPSPQSDGSAFVESFIAGALGDIKHGFDLGVQNQQTRNNLATELEKMIAADERVDVAHQLLAKLAERFAQPISSESGKQQLIIDFDETWGSYWFDWCKLYNKGPDLRNCTIVVELTGAQGDTRKNVHFIKSWPQGQTLYCPYAPGVPVNEKICHKRTVSNVKKVLVTILSPGASLQQQYQYTQDELDKDVKDYCEKLQFEFQYRPYDPGIVFTDERGAYIKMSGIQELPKGKVTLNFRKGKQSSAWSWDSNSWKHTEIKTFATPKGGLTFDPDDVEMSISFDSTKHIIRRMFKLQ